MQVAVALASLTSQMACTCVSGICPESQPLADCRIYMTYLCEEIMRYLWCVNITAQRSILEKAVNQVYPLVWRSHTLSLKLGPTLFQLCCVLLHYFCRSTTTRSSFLPERAVYCLLGEPLVPVCTFFSCFPSDAWGDCIVCPDLV